MAYWLAHFLCILLCLSSCGALVSIQCHLSIAQYMPMHSHSLTTHINPLFTAPKSSSLHMSINERERSQWTSNFLKGLKNLVTGNGWNGKSFLTKEQLTKLGLNALLAYGFVSNVSYITCLIIAWVAHGKKYSLSPLAPGQWKAFLLIYTGLWAANNVIRPVRFTLSLALSPAFDRLIDFFRRKTSLTKAQATGLVVVLVNVCGTISYLTFGLFLATRIAKIPLLP